MEKKKTVPRGAEHVDPLGGGSKDGRFSGLDNGASGGNIP